jgi:hypothetical protein
VGFVGSKTRLVTANQDKKMANYCLNFKKGGGSIEFKADLTPCFI